MVGLSLSTPEPLSEAHVLDGFNCGVASLDEWLTRKACANQTGWASRTYVVSDGQRVVGYYCLSSGALSLNDAPGPIRRNMPDPIPMAVLGRLAVDQSWRGKGLGAALLQDAVLRAAQAAGILDIRGILVHAVSEDAKAFYQHHGFISSPIQPMSLILSLRGVAA